MARAATDIGPKIGIDGEKEFRKQINDINNGVKTLGAEMKAVTSAYIGNETSLEALTAQNDVLQRTVYSLTERLDLQKERLAALTQEYGEADERTQKMQQAVYKTTAELNKAEAQIRQNTEAIDQLGEEEEDATEQTGKLGAIASKLGITFTLDIVSGAKLAADAIKKVAEYCADAVKKSAAYADEINTLSTNYSIATEKLQEYLYMTELVDTDMGTITSSITRLTKNMDAARGGTGDAANAFRLLGIEIKNSDGSLRDASDVFDLAIERLNYIQNSTERDALAMTLFGKSAMELNSLIAVGSDGLKGWADEAHALNYVLSDEQLATLAKVDDQFQRVNNTMDAVKRQIALQFAPEIIDLTDKFLDFAKTADWTAIGNGIIRTLKFVGSAISNAFGPIITLTRLVTGAAEAAEGAINAINTLLGKNTDSRAVAATVRGNTSISLSNPLPSSIDLAGGFGSSARTGAFGNEPLQTNVNVRFSGDLAQFANVMQPSITAETSRRGPNAVS